MGLKLNRYNVVGTKNVVQQQCSDKKGEYNGENVKPLYYPLQRQFCVFVSLVFFFPFVMPFPFPVQGVR